MIDSRPTTVYCASKLNRHPMWREWKAELSPSVIRIVSTWHDDPDVETLELDAKQCMFGWQANRRQILSAEHLLVFGTADDKLQGTLVEIGMALASDKYPKIHLVGSFDWGSWRFLDDVAIYATLHNALTAITGAPMHHPVKEHLLHDPT